MTLTLSNGFIIEECQEFYADKAYQITIEDSEYQYTFYFGIRNSRISLQDTMELTLRKVVAQAMDVLSHIV